MKLLYLLLSSLWSFRGGQLQCTCPVRWFSSLEIQLSRIKVLKQFNSKAQWGSYMYCSLYGGKCVLESVGGGFLCSHSLILSLKCPCWWNRSCLSVNQGRKCFLFNVLARHCGSFLNLTSVLLDEMLKFEVTASSTTVSPLWFWKYCLSFKLITMPIKNSGYSQPACILGLQCAGFEKKRVLSRKSLCYSEIGEPMLLLNKHIKWKGLSVAVEFVSDCWISEVNKRLLTAVSLHR